MFFLVSLASATCATPCVGTPGNVRLEIAGGIVTLAGAATTLGVMLPPTLAQHQTVGASGVGAAMLPLNIAGPLMVAAAGRNYRAALTARNIAPARTPWRYVAWPVMGLGIASSVAGFVQGMNDEPTGPWFQIAALPLFLGASLAFEQQNASYRAQLGDSPVSTGLSATPVVWSTPTSSGLGLTGSF